MSFARLTPYCFDGTTAPIAGHASDAARRRAAAPCVSPLWAWCTDTSRAFSAQLPQHQDVELVGIAEPTQRCRRNIRKVLARRRSLFQRHGEDDRGSAGRRRCWSTPRLPIIAARSKWRAYYGVSVMVEKPLTISLDDALAIRKIAREHHIQVLVNYETTWYASNKAAYDEVRARQSRRVAALLCMMAIRDRKRSAFRRSFSSGSLIPSRMAPARFTTSAAMAWT